MSETVLSINDPLPLSHFKVGRPSEFAPGSLVLRRAHGENAAPDVFLRFDIPGGEDFAANNAGPALRTSYEGRMPAGGIVSMNSWTELAVGSVTPIEIEFVPSRAENNVSYSGPYGQLGCVGGAWLLNGAENVESAINRRVRHIDVATWRTVAEPRDKQELWFDSWSAVLTFPADRRLVVSLER